MKLLKQGKRRAGGFSLAMLGLLLNADRWRDATKPAKAGKGVLWHQSPSLRKVCARSAQGPFIGFATPLLAAQGPQGFFNLMRAQERKSRYFLFP
jgi:hypothetical protein